MTYQQGLLGLDMSSTATNKVLDFGPPLAYPQICPAYTLEKLTLWEHTTKQVFELIALKAKQMPRARIEGNLYQLTDEELNELDNKRQAGVHCDRKRLPILVPIQEKSAPVKVPLHQKGEKLLKIYAHVYVGRNDYWVDQIEIDRMTTHAWDIAVTEGEFSLASMVPDSNQVLNNRFVFLPPPAPSVCSREVDPRVLKHVKRKNRETARQLWFINMRRRVSEFVNE